MSPSPATLAPPAKKPKKAGKTSVPFMQDPPRIIAEAKYDPAFSLDEINISAKALAANHRDHATAADKMEMEQLEASIAMTGQISPVLLYREDGVSPAEIVYGFRRIQVIHRLGLGSVKALVFCGTPTEQEIKQIRAIENLHRKNLDPVEEVFLVADLVDTHNGDRERAAQALGKSVSWINDRIYLQRLSEKVKDLLRVGQITLSQAREISKLGDHSDQLSVAETVAVDRDESKYRVYSLDETRDMVMTRQRSLRVVPWKLELPVFGKPACIGCKDNTTTDTTLFGVDAKEDQGAGFCMNAGCFNHKQRKSDDAKAATVKKLKDKGMEPTTQNVVAVAGKAAEAVKQDTLVRAAKKELGEPKAPAKSGGKPAETKSAKKTDTQRMQDAFAAWGKKYEAWRSQILEAVDNLGKKDPRKAVMIKLIEVADVSDGNELDVPTSEYDFGPYASFKGQSSPKPFPPLSKRAARMLGFAKQFTVENLEALGAVVSEKWQDGWHTDIANLRASPALVTELGLAFGVDVAPMPVFEDFLPADLKPKEPAAAKPSAATKAAATAVGKADAWLKIGAFVTVIDGPHKGKTGEVISLGHVQGTPASLGVLLQGIDGASTLLPREVRQATLVEVEGYKDDVDGDEDETE